MDEWFPLSSHVPLKGIEPGSLRVRARHSMEKIMPEEEYSEFKEVGEPLSDRSAPRARGRAPRAVPRR